MRAGAGLLLTGSALLVAGASGGCKVGEGKGSVSGTMEVHECTFDPSEGLIFPDLNFPYQMNPSFFVGQPIDADPMTAPGDPANQLIVRIQPSPARVEVADALEFYVFDSAAVARCLRPTKADGTGDWDPTLCDRSPTATGPGGEGRLFVGMGSETVRSYFVLNDSCPEAYVSADALGACNDVNCPSVALCPGRGSWISFSRFGSPPLDPTVPVSANFRVNDGEEIAASAFHVELCDYATVNATLNPGLNESLPVPPPNIRATLEGNFDFNLERGQASQPFP